MDKAFLCKDHIQMKYCLNYITEQYGEYYETYDDICKHLFIKTTGYYKENEPIIVLVTFELTDFQIEYANTIFVKDVKYWLYYRMSDDLITQNDWDKYEMIDFNKLLRKQKLERICK